MPAKLISTCNIDCTVVVFAGLGGAICSMNCEEQVQSSGMPTAVTVVCLTPAAVFLGEFSAALVLYYIVSMGV